MALDTATKRFAMMGMSRPGGSILPYYDNTIDIIHRLALLNIGFVSELATIVTNLYAWYIRL